MVIALAAVVVLMAAVTSAVTAFRVNARAQQTRTETQAAERMVLSGLARSLAVLVEQDHNLLTANDEWAEPGFQADELFLMPRGSFRIQIVDAGGFLNLNEIPVEHLEELPLTDEQIESLLDWREPDLQPRQLGAKDEYYRQLFEPYNAALAPLHTIEEVLLIKDWSAQTLYEPQENFSGDALVEGDVEDQPSLDQIVTVDSRSPNTSSDGEQKQSINQASTGVLRQAGVSQTVAQAIVDRRNTQGTYESLGEVFGVSGMTLEAAEIILNQFAVETDQQVSGQINLNTAGEAVLNSLPGMSRDITQAILGRQGTFEEVGELAQIPGVSLDVLQQIGGDFTLGSHAYLIRLMGEAGGTRIFREAVVLIEEEQPRLVRLNRPAHADMDVRWEWPEEPATETDVMGGSL
jgi:general secretion pathway protein K